MSCGRRAAGIVGPCDRDVEDAVPYEGVRV